MARQYNFERISALIIDGNWDMRRMLGSALLDFGVSDVEFAADGREALRKLKGAPIDLVISEYRLGHIDGIELTRQIRRSRYDMDPHLAVILMTSQTSELVVKSARDAGVSAVVAKPVAPAVLRDRIIHLTKNPRPFVRSREFFGPDRRIRDEGHLPDTPKRRAKDRGCRRVKSGRRASDWVYEPA